MHRVSGKNENCTKAVQGKPCYDRTPFCRYHPSTILFPTFAKIRIEWMNPVSGQVFLLGSVALLVEERRESERESESESESRGTALSTLPYRPSATLQSTYIPVGELLQILLPLDQENYYSYYYRSIHPHLMMIQGTASESGDSYAGLFAVRPTFIFFPAAMKIVKRLCRRARFFIVTTHSHHQIVLGDHSLSDNDIIMAAPIHSFQWRQLFLSLGSRNRLITTMAASIIFAIPISTPTNLNLLHSQTAPPRKNQNEGKKFSMSSVIPPTQQTSLITEPIKCRSGVPWWPMLPSRQTNEQNGEGKQSSPAIESRQRHGIHPYYERFEYALPTFLFRMVHLPPSG